MVAFAYYLLASLDIIAEEIEDPFRDDAHDIPANSNTCTAALLKTVAGSTQSGVIYFHLHNPYSKPVRYPLVLYL